MKVRRYDELLEVQGTDAELNAVVERAEREGVMQAAAGDDVVGYYLTDEDDQWCDFTTLHYVVTGRYQEYRDAHGLWDNDAIMRDLLAYTG